MEGAHHFEGWVLPVRFNLAREVLALHRRVQALWFICKRTMVSLRLGSLTLPKEHKLFELLIGQL